MGSGDASTGEPVGVAGARRAGILGRIARVAVGALFVLGTSSAPWNFLQFRVFAVPLFDSGWPYVYSYWGVGIVAAAMFAFDIGPNLRSRRELWGPIGSTAAFGGWLLLTAWWTLSPERSATEALLAVVLLTGALWWACSLSFREQFWILYVVLHVLVLSSYLVVRSKPIWGIDPYGSWHGLFANRNTLGPIATLAAVVALGALTQVARWWLRPLVVLPVVLDLYVAHRAGSVTAWVALVGSIVVGVAASGVAIASRKGVDRRRLTVACAVAGLGILATLPLVLDVLGGLGRGETLSGRRVVWDFAIDQVRLRPWRGYGFSSYWDHPELTADFNLATNGRWDSGHSTFVDTLLWSGVIGFALLLLLILVRVVGLTRSIVVGGGLPSVARLALLAFCLIENLAESMIGYHALFWVLIVAAVAVDGGPVRAPVLTDGPVSRAAMSHRTAGDRVPVPNAES